MKLAGKARSLLPRPPAGGSSADAGAHGSSRDAWIMVAVFVGAVGVRLGVVHSSGGFQALNGYDDGVYFSATAALLHGLVPYRDFVLLHPPGILALAAGPMSLAQGIGLSDADTLVVMRVLFVCLGGVNAVLTFTAGRHLSRSAGVVAACLYCVWDPAIREERTMLLEPLVILGTLVALSLVPPVSTRVIEGRWRPILAGALGGLAVATKLWAVVPVLIVTTALLVVRRWRRAMAYFGMTCMVALCVAAPFLLLAPSQMWQMLVSSQIGRPSISENRLVRFAEMGNLSTWPFSSLARPSLPPLHPVPPVLAWEQFTHSGRLGPVVAAVVTCLVVLAVIVAIRLAVARVWVALLVVQSTALMATPVFFHGYASFVAPAGMLLVGAGAHLVWASRLLRTREGLRRVTCAAAVAALGLAGWGAVMTDRGAPVRSKVAPLVASARCVASDSPALLVLVNRLSTNLDNGCPTVVDFSGVVYTMDYPRGSPISPTRLREESAQFQRFVQDYFAQADYVVLRRRTMTGLSEATMAILERRPLVLTRPRVFGTLGTDVGPDSTRLPADQDQAPAEEEDMPE